MLWSKAGSSKPVDTQEMQWAALVEFIGGLTELTVQALQQINPSSITLLPHCNMTYTYFNLGFENIVAVHEEV